MGGKSSHHQPIVDLIDLRDGDVAKPPTKPATVSTEYLRIDEAKKYWGKAQQNHQALESKSAAHSHDIKNIKESIQSITRVEASQKGHLDRLETQVQGLTALTNRLVQDYSAVPNQYSHLSMRVDADSASLAQRISTLERQKEQDAQANREIMEAFNSHLGTFSQKIASLELQNQQDAQARRELIENFETKLTALERVQRDADLRKDDEIARLKKKVGDLEKETEFLKFEQAPPRPAAVPSASVSPSELALIRTESAEMRSEIQKIRDWLTFNITPFVINLITASWQTFLATLPMPPAEAPQQGIQQPVVTVSPPPAPNPIEDPRPAQPQPSQQLHINQPATSQSPSQKQQPPTPCRPTPPQPVVSQQPAVHAVSKSAELKLAEPVHLGPDKFRLRQAAAQNNTPAKSTQPPANRAPKATSTAPIYNKFTNTLTCRSSSSSKTQIYLLVDPTVDISTKFEEFLKMNLPGSGRYTVTPIGLNRLEDATPKRQALCILPLTPGTPRWLTELIDKLDLSEKLHSKFARVEIVLLKQGKKSLEFSDEDNDVSPSADGNKTGRCWKVLGRFLHMNNQFHESGMNVSTLHTFWNNVDSIISELSHGPAKQA